MGSNERGERLSRGFVFDRYEALGRYVDGWMDGWWRYNTGDELFERGSNLQKNCEIGKWRCRIRTARRGEPLMPWHRSRRQSAYISSLPPRLRLLPHTIGPPIPARTKTTNTVLLSSYLGTKHQKARFATAPPPNSAQSPISS